MLKYINSYSPNQTSWLNSYYAAAQDWYKVTFQNKDTGQGVCSFSRCSRMERPKQEMSSCSALEKSRLAAT
jgi:hypothetical protein